MAAEEPPPPGQYVDIAPVAVPILADGQLINYIFVSLRVQLTATADAPKWRAKEPHFRDALARLCNRVSLVGPTDYISVDVERLIALYTPQAVAIAGKNVKAVTLMSQTPKQRLGLPSRSPKPPRAEIQP